VWQAREELDIELARMTNEQIREYADRIHERFKARTGRELKLKMADRSAVETQH